MSVLVFTENWDGKFKKLSFELVSYSNKVAEMLGTSTTAISIGSVADDELTKLGKFGAKKILKLENEIFKTFDTRAYSSAIAQIAQKEKAEVIVIANNNMGKAIAPRLSVKLKAAVGSGVTKPPLSTEPFVVNKKVYSGNAFAHMELKTGVKIITLAQNSFDLIETSNDATIEEASVDIDKSAVQTKVKDVEKQTGKLLLTDAEIVVAGGRGMKSPDNWTPLIELAETLGGATACSRPVSDEGWRPHEEHTGQTGKIIAPNLYIAIGIS